MWFLFKLSAFYFFSIIFILILFFLLFLFVYLFCIYLYIRSIFCICLFISIIVYYHSYFYYFNFARSLHLFAHHFSIYRLSHLSVNINRPNCYSYTIVIRFMHYSSFLLFLISLSLSLPALHLPPTALPLGVECTARRDRPSSACTRPNSPPHLPRAPPPPACHTPLARLSHSSLSGLGHSHLSYWIMHKGVRAFSTVDVQITSALIKHYASRDSY